MGAPKHENHLRLRLHARGGARIFRPARCPADASESDGGDREAPHGAARQLVAGIGPAQLDVLRARSVPGFFQEHDELSGQRQAKRRIGPLLRARKQSSHRASPYEWTASLRSHDYQAASFIIAAASSRKARRRILPTFVLGSSLRNSI